MLTQGQHMPLCVRSASFLRVELSDGRVYEHDIVVYPDGRVERRKWKSLSKPYADAYHHTPLSREELEKYLREAGDIDCLIVGTGTEGRMKLTPEAEELVKGLGGRGVRVITAKTTELPRLCSEMKECRRPLMVIHVTC